MKNFRILRWGAAVGACLLGFSLQAGPDTAAVFATDAGAGANADPGITNAAAIVDGHVISLDEVRLKCLRECHEFILQAMIPDYVLDRECTKRGITVAEAEIDRRIANLRTSLAPATLEDRLQKNYLTMADARDDIRRELEKPLLIAGQIKTLPLVHCRELVVTFGSARTESTALEMATDFRQQIVAGADFTEMVARHSDGEAKEKNGDLGVLYEKILRSVEAPVLDAALALKPGEVSPPIKAKDGYHLIKAESTGAEHPASEDDLYTEAAATARHQQINFLVPETISALLKHSKITFAEDDLVPGQPLPEAAAVVDGHPIPMKDVLDKCMAEYGPKITDILVQNYLVDRECARRGLSVTESEIDQRIAALKLQCAPLTLEEGMKIHHTTLPELRYDFRQKIERTELAMDQTRPTRMVHARIILVKPNPVDQSDATRADQVARAQINDIQNQLAAGTRFEALAARYCMPDDPSKSGDMGIIYPYMQGVDTDIANAAGTMKKGDISTVPIKSYSGYALLQIISDSDNHPTAEDAVYTKAQDTYRSSAAQQWIQQMLVTLIKKSNVAYYVHA